MSANVPIVKRIAWAYTVPHLLLMFGLIWFLWKVQFPDRFDVAMLYGACCYLVYSFGSKAVLLKHHRRGISLSKVGSFREAIIEFQASYSFLRKFEWVDKFRFVTLLDSSAITYREMALCNIAFAYFQLGEKSKSKEFYQKALAEFPSSDMAKSGLDFVDADESS